VEEEAVACFEDGAKTSLNIPVRIIGAPAKTCNGHVLSTS
jgi:hypothetical protein